MTRPWPAIRGHFETLGARFGAMADLVHAIESSELGERLFALTSLSELRVVSAPVTYPYDGPYLSVKLVGDQIELRFVDTSDKNKQWHRTVQTPHAFGAMRAVCKDLCWA